MIVVLSQEAEADLEQIGDYIALDRPSRAVTFVQELRSSCEKLAHMPMAFPLVPRYEHAGIRRLVHGNYLILYRIVSETIDIIHILHGARDYEQQLFASL